MSNRELLVRTFLKEAVDTRKWLWNGKEFSENSNIYKCLSALHVDYDKQLQKLNINRLPDGLTLGQLNVKIISAIVRKESYSMVVHDVDETLAILFIHHLDLRLSPMQLTRVLAPERKITIHNPVVKHIQGNMITITVDNPHRIIFDAPQDRCFAIGCGKLGIHKCSRCHFVTYCSRDCQTLDWKFHKKSCVPVKEFTDPFSAIQSAIREESTKSSINILYQSPSTYVKVSPDKKGRGVFAKSSIKSNTVLLVETPLFRSNQSELLQLIYRTKRYDTRVLKLLELHPDTNTFAPYMIDQHLIKEFQSLEGDKKKKNQNTIKLKWGHSLWTVLRAKSVLDANSFAVGESTTGIFYHASRFNHTCWANAVWVNLKSVMLIYSTRDIKEGDEIVVQYADPMEGGAIAELEGRDFSCSCLICCGDDSIIVPTRYSSKTPKEVVQLLPKLEEVKEELGKRAAASWGKKPGKEIRKLIQISQQIREIFDWMIGPGSSQSINELFLEARLRSFGDGEMFIRELIRVEDYLNKNCPYDIEMYYKWILPNPDTDEILKICTLVKEQRKKLECEQK